MKESSLRDYFASTPGWRRQLAQLRKKCLAGYADGMIRLQDATPEECRAAEGLLGRHFVPPLLRYKMSDFEKACEYCFDYALACDTYQKYNCKDIPSLDNSSIPAEISDIHYDCDLSKVTPLGVPSEIFPNSKLIKSL